MAVRCFATWKAGFTSAKKGASSKKDLVLGIHVGPTCMGDPLVDILLVGIHGPV